MMVRNDLIFLAKDLKQKTPLSGIFYRVKLKINNHINPNTSKLLFAQSTKGWK